MEACRSSMYGRNHHVTSSFRLRLWAEAMAHAVYTLNRTLSRTGTVTPYQKYHGVKPSVSHLRGFGLLCYSHIPDERRRKLDPKGEKCILLGYETTGYRVLILATLRVKITRDVVFDEENDLKLDLPQERLPSQVIPPFFPLASTSKTTIEAATPIETGATPDIQLEKQPTTEAAGPIETGTPPDTQAVIPAAEINEPATYESVNTDVPTCPNRRYPLRNRKPKVTLSMKSTDIQFPDSPFEPQNYKEATQSDEAHLWDLSMIDEFNSHQTNGTWILTDLPEGRKAIGTRWIYKIKPGHLTTPARYKSRLVAKGYAQVEGIDFQETSAPVVKYTSLRIPLSYAAVHDWEMSQLDIKTTFLYGLVDEELYIEQPEGFIKLGQEKLVCKLIKCI